MPVGRRRGGDRGEHVRRLAGGDPVSRVGLQQAVKHRAERPGMVAWFGVASQQAATRQVE